MVWMYAGVSCAAWAGARVELGVETSGMLPTRERAGAVGSGVSAALRANPWLSVELAGSHLLALAQDRAVRRFRRHYVTPVEPSLATRVNGAARLETVFSPLQGHFVQGSVPFAVDVGAGFGMVQTADDLQALGVEPGDPGEPLARATANQVHPTLVWTLGPRVGIGSRGFVSLRVRGAHWIETFESIQLKRMTQVRAALGVGVRI